MKIRTQHLKEMSALGRQTILGIHSGDREETFTSVATLTILLLQFCARHMPPDKRDEFIGEIIEASKTVGQFAIKDTIGSADA